MMWRAYWGCILAAIVLVPVISAGCFWIWLRHVDGLSPDLNIKAWEAFIKLISALTVTFTGALLFGKYIDELTMAEAVKNEQYVHEIALRKAEFLRQKLLFDTQRHDRNRGLLDEAKKVAARIANSAAPESAALIRFNELYYSDLIGVEKPQGGVESAMVRFRGKLKEEHRATGDLEVLSLELSRAVNEEVAASEAMLLAQHEGIQALMSSAAVPRGKGADQRHPAP